MKVERTDLIKKHLEDKGVPVKPDTFKAYLVGKLSQIAGEIEDHLTGGVPAREILKHNMEYFEEFGEALGHNRTHYSIGDVQIPELGRGVHCPLCGSRATFFEGGTDWNPDERYLCESCHALFTVESEGCEELE